MLIKYWLKEKKRLVLGEKVMIGEVFLVLGWGSFLTISYFYGSIRHNIPSEHTPSIF